MGNRLRSGRYSDGCWSALWNVNPVACGVDAHSSSSVCPLTGVLSASGHLLRTKSKTLKVSSAWKHFPTVERLSLASRMSVWSIISGLHDQSFLMSKAFSSTSVMGREQALLPPCCRGACVICIALCTLECREPGQAQARLLLPWQEAVTRLQS